MRSTSLFLNSVALLLLCSCAGKSKLVTVHSDSDQAATEAAAATDKAAQDTVKSPENFSDKLTDLELRKYAYEIGLDPTTELSPADLLAIDKRKRVRNLERTLDSQKERFNYSKVLPWLKSDDEKIQYLSIPSVEGRQAWSNKNEIWKRAKNSKDYQDVMENLDIAAGMPADYVIKAWGEPDSIEHSGNPIYKNERWKYLKQVSTPNGYRQEKRYVFFEGGRVVGWETE